MGKPFWISSGFGFGLVPFDGVPFDGVSPNSIVVMDNASIHHVDSVVDTILSVEALVRFLPPYSPDMNPIEEVFGEVKHYLQANNTRFQATSSPRAMILTAFNSVTTENCNSYIRHSARVCNVMLL